MTDLGIATERKQDILVGMNWFTWAVLLFPLSLLAQKLDPCPPNTPALKMTEALRTGGLHVGGVEVFPAGIYKPMGKNDDGTFYFYEKLLTAKLMAETILVEGGLFIPTDPEDDAKGWYCMPDGARNVVIAPEQGVDSSWEGDPTLPASNPYQASNLSKIRRLTSLSGKPKLDSIQPTNP